MRFELLGPVVIRTPGRSVNAGVRQQRFLLAVLALEVNRLVPVERLIDLTWPEHPPRTARRVVHSQVSRLRTTLAKAGADEYAVHIRSTAAGYTLACEPSRVDAHRFTDLVQRARQTADDPVRAGLLAEALGLWRGPALAGTASTQVSAELCGHLDEARVTSAEDRLETLLRLGRYEDVVDEAIKLRADHPYRHRITAAHLLALHRHGRTADALAVYRDTKIRFSEQLGLDPPAELIRVHSAILRPPEGGSLAPPAVAEVRPAQLPADVRGFAGRQAALAALGRSPAPICVVHGTAGVGKTALALRFAHSVRGRFPDGQLFVDLHGFDPSRPPMNPNDALGGLLRALGIDSRQIPGTVEERAGLFRSASTGRRLLLLLDNAATAEQVRPLLPNGEGCLTVVTSRSKLGGIIALDGADHLALEPLNRAEALGLLENVLGRERIAVEHPAATELADLCGGLPLALRIAAGRLLTGSGHRVEDLIGRLRAQGQLTALTIDGDQRSNLGAAFQLSYRALDPPAQRLYRRLGLAGPDFALPAAAALAGLAHRTAEAALSELVSANLVEHVSATRYRMHDLVRLHAQYVCDTDESSGETAAAFERLFRWYAAAANAAARMLYPGRPAGYPSGRGWREDEGDPALFPADADAWAWLEAERPNFATLVGAAARYGLAPVAWHFTDSLWGFFQFRSYHDTWLTVARAGLRTTEQTGDELGQAVMHLGVASAYWGLGDDQNYLRHSALAIPQAKQAGWPAGEAKALRNQSDAHRGLGAPRPALDCLERALALHREQEDSAEIAHDLIVLAHTHAQLGDLQRSLTYLEQAVELARKGGSLLTEVIGLYALGRVQAGLGRQGEAETSYRTSLRHALELGIADRAAFNLGALAEMACDAGRRAEAEDLLRQALSRGSTRTETVGEVHNMAGRVALRLGRTETAVEHHQQALDAARLTRNVPIRAEALLGLAEARTASARCGEARLLAHRAKNLVEPGGYRILTAQALTTLGDVELADDNGQRARTYLEQALRLHRATGHHPGEVRTLRSLRRS